MNTKCTKSTFLILIICVFVFTELVSAMEALNPNLSFVDMFWPFDGLITSTFEPPDRPHHEGIDIDLEIGDPIVSAADGTVIDVIDETDSRYHEGAGYGKYIVIDHGNGITTVYAHLSNILATKGQNVHGGTTVVGKGGATGGVRKGNGDGSHLHFEVRVNGKHVDPLKYLPNRKNTKNKPKAKVLRVKENIHRCALEMQKIQTPCTGRKDIYIQVKCLNILLSVRMLVKA